MLFPVLFFASLAAAQVTRVIDWNVSWFNACPDGVCRNVITVNDRWPPGTVRIKRREVLLYASTINLTMASASQFTLIESINEQAIHMTALTE